MPHCSLHGFSVTLALMFGLMHAAVPDACGQETTRTSLTRDQGRTLLSRIETWGCQYQNIDPESIANSALDLIVIDSILDGTTGRTADPSEVARMQRKPDGARRLIFAYLSIGAAEEYRSYWKPSWLVDKPDWLGSQSSDWPGSYSVKYWHSDWEHIVVQALRLIVAAGFDGAFLDRVDAYDDWRNARPGAFDEMAEFVIRLADDARAQRPGFMLISQNAEPMLSLDRFNSVIDGVSKESLLTGLQGQGTENRSDQIAWSMNYLTKAQQVGLPILTIEYLTAPSDIADVQQRHQALGFKLFSGERLLDRLP